MMANNQEVATHNLAHRLKNWKQSKQILERVMQDEPTSPDMDYEAVAKMTEGFSGSDLHELCRSASVYRMRDSLKTSGRNATAQAGDAALRLINMDDLRKAFSKIRESKVHCTTLGTTSTDMD